MAHFQSEKRDRLVHIYARQRQSQACKQCLVSDALLKAQNYNGGQRHIWIPKASLQSQIPREKPKLVQACMHQLAKYGGLKQLFL